MVGVNRPPTGGGMPPYLLVPASPRVRRGARQGTEMFVAAPTQGGASQSQSAVSVIEAAIFERWSCSGVDSGSSRAYLRPALLPKRIL